LKTGKRYFNHSYFNKAIDTTIFFLFLDLNRPCAIEPFNNKKKPGKKVKTYRDFDKELFSEKKGFKEM